MSQSAKKPVQTGLYQTGFSICAKAGEDAAFVPIADPVAAKTVLTGASDDTSALIIFVPPAIAIAHLMGQGQSLDAAQQTWSDQATEHLKIARKWRKKVRLVVAPQTAQALDQTRAALLDVWPDANDIPLPAPPDDTADVVMAAVATVAIQTNKALGDQIDDLYTRSTGPTLPLADVETCLSDVVQRWTAQQTQLMDEQHRFATQSQDLARKIATLEEEVQATQSTKAEAAQTVVVMTAQISDLEKALQDNSAQFAAERKSLHSAAATQQSALQKQLDEQRSAAQQREADITRALTAQVKTLEETLKAKIEAATQQHAQHQKTAADLAATQKSLEDATKAGTAAREECAQLYTRIKELQAKIDGPDAPAAGDMAQITARQVRDLEDALQSRAAAARALNAQKAALEKQLTDATNTLASKIQALDTLQAENNKLTASLDAMRASNTTSVTKISTQSKAQLAEKNAQLGEMQRQLETAHQAETSKLTARIASAHKELEIERQLTTTLGQQIGDLEKTLLSVPSGNAADAPQNGVQITAEDLTRMTELKDVYKTHAKQLEIALQAVDADRRDLRANLDEMYASTSWRVTGPMRSLRRVVRK